MSSQRISRQQLDHIREQLNDRDEALLHALDRHRLLTTRQLASFCFADKQTDTAALRATNRALAKLQSLHLIVALERRIGGVRAGSGSYVWAVAVVGGRLLQLLDAGTDTVRRRRSFEPSAAFLEHTLAVAEVHLRLRAAERRDLIRLSDVQFEPACWRPYLGSGGGLVRLKPDLAAVTETASFEDHWFFEIDLATEPPSRIIQKCLQYQEYQRTGTEQRRLGLFPAVIWIVPTITRRDTLTRRLETELNITDGLFTIITLDQLDDLLTGGPQSVNTQQPQQGGQKGGQTP